MRLVGARGQLGVILVSTSQTATPVANVGTWWLDQAFHFVLAASVIAASERIASSISIPNQPGIRGLDVGVQAMGFDGKTLNVSNAVLQGPD